VSATITNIVLLHKFLTTTLVSVDVHLLVFVDRQKYGTMINASVFVTLILTHVNIHFIWTVTHADVNVAWNVLLVMI